MKGKISETKCIMYLSRLHNGMSMIIPGVVITVKKTSNQLGKVCCIYNFRNFKQKGKLLLKSLLSESRYFRGVVTFGIRCFRRVASFAKGGGDWGVVTIGS